MAGATPGLCVYVSGDHQEIIGVMDVDQPNATIREISCFPHL